MDEEYVVWEAESEVIPLEKASAYTKEDFENILVQSPNKKEIVRVSAVDEAAEFLDRLPGMIFDTVDEDLYIIGAAVRGRYAESCMCDERLDEIGTNKYRKVGKLFDYRLASSKGDVNYFDLDNGIRCGEDYVYQDIFRKRNRPDTSVKDKICFDRMFVNKFLNKESLSQSDRQIIADVVSSFMMEYSESEGYVHVFETFLKQEMGEAWFQNMMIKFRLWF